MRRPINRERHSHTLSPGLALQVPERCAHTGSRNSERTRKGTFTEPSLTECPIRRAERKPACRFPDLDTSARSLALPLDSVHSDSRRGSRPNEHTPATPRSHPPRTATSQSGSISWRFLSRRERDKFVFFRQQTVATGRGGEPTVSLFCLVGQNIPSTSARCRMCELPHTTLCVTTDDTISLPPLNEPRCEPSSDRSDSSRSRDS